MEKTKDNIVIGQYGRLKEQYLKYSNPKEYRRMVKEKELKPYLLKIDKIAAEMEEELANSLAKGNGLTEEMRNKDPDRWIGLMNNFRMCAREMVIKDIIEE